MGIIKRITGVFSAKPDRPQPNILFTEDLRILDIVHDTFKGYCVNESTHEAWLLDGLNRVYDPKYGWMQVITERSMAPLPLWEDVEVRKAKLKKEFELLDTDDKKIKLTHDEYLLEQIAYQSTEEALCNIAENAAKDRRWWVIYCIVITLCLSILLTVYNDQRTNGNIKIPFINISQVILWQK